MCVRLCFSRCVSVRVGCFYSWLVVVVVVVAGPGACGSFVADGAESFGAGSEVWGEVGDAAGEVAWCAPCDFEGALSFFPLTSIGLTSVPYMCVRLLCLQYS